MKKLILLLALVFMASLASSFSSNGYINYLKPTCMPETSRIIYGVWSNQTNLFFTMNNGTNNYMNARQCSADGNTQIKNYTLGYRTDFPIQGGLIMVYQDQMFIGVDAGLFYSYTNGTAIGSSGVGDIKELLRKPNTEFMYVLSGSPTAIRVMNMTSKSYIDINSTSCASTTIASVDGISSAETILFRNNSLYVCDTSTCFATGSLPQPCNGAGSFVNISRNVNNNFTNYFSGCSSGICQYQQIENGAVYSVNAGTFGDSSVRYSLFYDGFLENNVNYSSSVVEQQSNTIIGNFTIDPAPTSVYLVYNNVNYTPTISSSGANYILTSTVTPPSVTTDTNISFYYVFNIGGSQYTSTSKNQTVLNIILTTNCTNNYPFLNISNFDEETLTSLNGTVEYKVTLLSNDNEVSAINGSVQGFTSSLCSNINLSSNFTNYNLQLRYYATGYVYETYNVQNSEVSNTPISINLYFLNSSVGTQFTIDYTDFYYITYPGAIMQIQRQYISEDIYRLIELPKLDNNGQALASFNTNNIRYKIIVINQGQVIDTFEDVFPVCQNLVLGQCEINLRGAKTITTSTTGDFTYTLVKSNTSITLTYVIPSGTPRTIELTTSQNSRFLSNITTCSQSVFASGGTLTCSYNATIGDSIIDTQIINSDGTTLYASILVPEDLDDFFLLNNYFIGFVIVLSLVFMFISSGVMLVIVTAVSVIYLGLIFLIRGVDIVTLTGSIGWLVVAVVVIIYTISKKEERT